MRPPSWVRCSRCGIRADRSIGVYLERLYPREFFCQGCGRRTLFCSCLDVALAKAA